jgi:tetratricopeptide (TPR) repeat protein
MNSRNGDKVTTIRAVGERQRGATAAVQRVPRRPVIQDWSYAACYLCGVHLDVVALQNSITTGGLKMEDKLSNAAFISYRREVSGILAMALFQHLADHGIDTFYDIESIRAGQFDSIILRQIASRPYFLLVLTPGSLERCVEPNDWVLKEIEHAVATQRVIVPSHTPNFDFEDLERYLPSPLGETVRRYNGQELPQRWFKPAVQQLVDEFLLPISAESTSALSADEPVVDRILQSAQGAPVVTDTLLSAQEYFERALSRPDSDVDGQLADLDEAIRLNPRFDQAFGYRGLARWENDDESGAIADWDEAIRLNPAQVKAFHSRGVFERLSGDLERALADFDEAIRLDPGFSFPYVERGQVWASKNNDERALSDYNEAIRLNPTYAEAFFRRSLVGGGHDAARTRSDLDEAIRLDPQHVYALMARGVFLQKMDDDDGAIRDLDKALDLNQASGFPPRASVFLAYLSRGQAHFSKGELSAAIVDFDEAIRLDPQSAEAFFWRAGARGRVDPDGQIADLEEAIRLDPTNKVYPELLKSITPGNPFPKPPKKSRRRR